MTPKFSERPFTGRFGTIMQLIACDITTVQLEVYRETHHGTFCDNDQEYLVCRGGCTLEQEGSHDPLECRNFFYGLHERPLG